MTIASRSKLAAQMAAAFTVSAALSGCYVVPLQQAPIAMPPGPMQAPAPLQPLTFGARLYPSNDLASRYGMVSAVVTNDLNGRGQFSTAINGETFTGESTRLAGSTRD